MHAKPYCEWTIQYSTAIVPGRCYWTAFILGQKFLEVTQFKKNHF